MLEHLNRILVSMGIPATSPECLNSCSTTYLHTRTHPKGLIYKITCLNGAFFAFLLGIPFLTGVGFVPSRTTF